MLAGHITLKLVERLCCDAGQHWHGRDGSARSQPLALTVALTALELLVAVLQAYVFTILTCIYLNDALHPGPLKDISLAKPSNPLPIRSSVWIPSQQNSSVPAWHHRHGRRRPSAWPTCSVNSWSGRCAIRPPPPGQNTNLFLGFALAEAFGIFSLLIALLLLFVL